MKYLLFLSFIFFNTLSAQPLTYKPPVQLNDGIKCNSLLSLEVDTLIYNSFLRGIAKENHKLHSMLVMKNGELVFEEYFNGQIMEDKHDLRSATKSIRSLLVGIALDKGFIKSLDDPINLYLQNPVPQKNPDPEKDKITVRHLISMSSGLDCNDHDRKSKGQEDRIYRKKDWLQYFMDLPMLGKAGDTSLYCSMGTVLAMEVISQASGMPIDSFAASYLFKPMGIADYKWGHTSKKKDILTSAKRLYMRPRDVMKLGQLVLQNGSWNGKQIISKEWIKLSTSTQVKLDHQDYGFLWWQMPFQLNEKRIIAKAAKGNGGQYILIFPNDDLVCVFTGGAYNSQKSIFPAYITQKLILTTLGSL